MFCSSVVDVGDGGINVGVVVTKTVEIGGGKRIMSIVGVSVIRGGLFAKGLGV
jgi:hypothetical protein